MARCKVKGRQRPHPVNARLAVFDREVRSLKNARRIHSAPTQLVTPYKLIWIETKQEIHYLQRLGLFKLLTFYWETNIVPPFSRRLKSHEPLRDLSPVPTVF